MTIVSTDAPDKFQQLRSSAGRFAERLRRFLPRRWRSDIAVVPVVRLTGTIGFSTPLRPGLTLAGIAKTLDRAFAIRRARAVALVINSPGGSAVQSHLIFRRLRELADEKQLPIIAFVEDVAASGGYMIACAADEIVCDPASIVGSIGVIGATFGFPEAMKKLGIERRVYTAGESKSMLDPFLPETEDDVRRLAGVRLSGPDTLFSGEYWAAATAKEFGLVDALGEVRSFLRARFGDKVAMPLIATERTLFGRRVPGISGASQHMLDGALDGAFNRTGIFEELLSAIEARSLWGRFGL
jgi:serine protease SohB